MTSPSQVRAGRLPALAPADLVFQVRREENRIRLEAVQAFHPATNLRKARAPVARLMAADLGLRLDHPLDSAFLLAMMFRLHHPMPTVVRGVVSIEDELSDHPVGRRLRAELGQAATVLAKGKP